MQLDDAEDVHMRPVNDFESELKRRCTVLLNSYCTFRQLFCPAPSLETLPSNGT